MIEAGDDVACTRRGRHRHERDEISRLVDIERDVRQAHDRRLDAMRTGCVEMGEIAVGAEAQRHAHGLGGQDRVRAELVARRHDDEAGRAPMGVDDLADISGRDQRHVAGQRQHRRAIAGQSPGGRRHRAGVAIACAIGPDIRAPPAGCRGCIGVQRDHGDAGQFVDRGEGLQHVIEHGERQLPARLGRQQPCQPLLGEGRLLDRYDCPNALLRCHPAPPLQ